MLKSAHTGRKTLRCLFRLMTVGATRASILDMSVRLVIITLAVGLGAGALLFGVDYQSLAPQSSNVFAVR